MSKANDPTAIALAALNKKMIQFTETLDKTLVAPTKVAELEATVADLTNVTVQLNKANFALDTNAQTLYSKNEKLNASVIKLQNDFKLMSDYLEKDGGFIAYRAQMQQKAQHEARAAYQNQQAFHQDPHYPHNQRSSYPTASYHEPR